MQNLITDHLDIWTAAHKTRSTAGRGSNNKLELVGIKKLRELILELAVRGKLVPQDPNDEPASELLKKIAAEKKKLIEEGKIKKEKPLPEITDEEILFELPRGWARTRLGNAIQISSGDGLTSAQMTPNSDIPVFGGNGINGYHDQANVYEPTLVIGRVGFYCGSIHITPNKAWITDNAFITKFSRRLFDLQYLALLLKSTNLKEDENATAQPVISGRKIYPIVIGFPPLPEQHRIVAKVDELMAFCDQLEKTQSDNIAAHAQLVEALLATLTNSSDHFELQNNWQRIATHFDILFTTEHSIDQLKQTILQLAVMGKLVPQNPNDEPASELLKKIAAEKAQLIKEGKIKKEKPLPEITDEEKPFELPRGWEWCRLNRLVTLLGDGLHGTPDYDDAGDYYFVNGNNLKNGAIDIKAETKKVNEQQYLKHKKDLNSTTVLVSINGTLGNVAFYNNEPIMLGKSACYFNLCTGLSKPFIKCLIDSPYFINYAFESATGSTIKNLGLGAMNSFPIALPSLNEQHRIVTKVDELMALCDTLKTNLQNAQTTQLALADALVEQAVC